uniref:Uncharacterized protein n=1 Tax=Arundo donax TaxID=35708 RepID=A0A0A9GWC4_ARUDO
MIGVNTLLLYYHSGFMTDVKCPTVVVPRILVG